MCVIFVFATYLGTLQIRSLIIVTQFVIVLHQDRWQNTVMKCVMCAASPSSVTNMCSDPVNLIWRFHALCLNKLWQN